LLDATFGWFQGWRVCLFQDGDVDDGAGLKRLKVLMGEGKIIHLLLVVL